VQRHEDGIGRAKWRNHILWICFDELKRIAHPYEDEDNDFDTMGNGGGTGRERDCPSMKENPVKSNPDPYGTIRKPRRNNRVVNIHATIRLQMVLVKPDRPRRRYGREAHPTPRRRITSSAAGLRT